jgi:pyruvyltransferase
LSFLYGRFCRRVAIMTKPLRLYWSRSKPNFGDWLSPAICEALSGRRVEYAPVARCDLVAVGSLFERLPRGYLGRRLDVWGTGSLDRAQPARLRHRFHALRGPLTAGLVRGQPAHVFGDPGLLAELLVPSARAIVKSAPLGIVPHYKDARRAAVRDMAARIPGAKVIDVLEPPLRVIEAIAGCRRVASSSLHGLVVAEALGVPARWLQLSDAVRGGGWKFRDYYLGTGRDPVLPLTADAVKTESLGALFDDHPPGDLEAVKRGLVSSFPCPKSACP